MAHFKKELNTFNYSEALCYPRIAFLLIGQLKNSKIASDTNKSKDS